MTDIRSAERIATRRQVIVHAKQLRKVLRDHGLTNPRVRHDGVVIVHTADPGYGPLNRATLPITEVVGVHVQLITDDVPGAINAEDAIAM
ncbi:MAG: hypothetical protein ACR2HR_07255 [Euzebya sp.]